MHHTNYPHMLKILILTSFTILIALTVNLYLIPEVISSSESSSLSPEDSGDDNENNGSGSEDDSPQDDSGISDTSNLDGSESDDGGFRQTDERELKGDDYGEEEEPPASTDRGDNPLEGLNLPSGWGKEECAKYLKSLGGSDETNVGDVIVGPFETREDYCKRILGGAGIDTSNTTTTTKSELMNQSGLTNNISATEGDFVITEEGKPSEPCIVITEEGMPSGPKRPQPQPSPSPKPC